MTIPVALKRRFEVLPFDAGDAGAITALLPEDGEREHLSVSVSALPTTQDRAGHIEPENALLNRQAQAALDALRHMADSWPSRLRDLFPESRGARFFLRPVQVTSSPVIKPAMVLA